VLHPVAQLAQHGVGHVQRVLGDEIDAHALGAHQAHHQLDALDQASGASLNSRWASSKKNQLGLVQVAHLGQGLEQLRQHPQQEGGVQPRRVHQLVGGQDVDHALAVHGLHEVGDVEHGLAEELVAALLLDLQQAALDGADGGGADVAVLGGELAGVVAHVLQHGAQVLQVQQGRPWSSAILKTRFSTPAWVSLRASMREQQRAHVGHGGAHRVALLAEDVPQRGRAGDGGGAARPRSFRMAASLSPTCRPG
jgi:hypothetical protein